jgi:spectinomycin phosphotransferase
MRAAPVDLEAGELLAAAASEWGFGAESAEYAPVGGGSHHWVLKGPRGSTRFATVDDLDQKAWLGDTRESVLGGLTRAFTTVLELEAAGLTFVVAPLQTRSGAPLHRLGPRYSLALFPFVAGETGEFGRYDEPTREALQRLLAHLHGKTGAVAAAARRVGLAVPGRLQIDWALADLDHAWSGGPLSEPARETLATHATDVAELLALADRLAAAVQQHGRPWVITHGEPHAANVMKAKDTYLLIDWDTVGLAPRERDLWMLAAAGDVPLYRAASGHDLDPDAISLYRLGWDLSDLAEYLTVLRSPHAENEDTRRALVGVANCAGSRNRWRHLL